MFADDQILTLAGELRTWRRWGDAGRWVEQSNCVTCATLVFMRGEALRNALAVSVGCFADPGFMAPATFHRRSRSHEWYQPAAGIRSSD